MDQPKYKPGQIYCFWGQGGLELQARYYLLLRFLPGSALTKHRAGIKGECWSTYELTKGKIQPEIFCLHDFVYSGETIAKVIGD